MAWSTRRTLGGAADSDPAPGYGGAGSANAQRAVHASWALSAALEAEPLQTQIMNHLSLANDLCGADSGLAPTFAAAWSTAPPERRRRMSNWAARHVDVDQALIPHSTARNPAMQYTHGRYFGSSSSVCCPRPRDKEKWACHHNPQLDRFIQRLKGWLAPSHFNFPGLVMTAILLPWCTSDGKHGEDSKAWGRLAREHMLSCRSSASVQKEDSLLGNVVAMHQ